MLYLTKTIKIIAIVIALFFAYFVAINWNDEELRPEVVQALDWKPPANAYQENGYLTLLGIEAPMEMDAEKVGKKALEAELARFTSMQKRIKKPLHKRQILPKLINTLIGKTINAITKSNKTAWIFICSKVQINLLWC